MVNNWFKLNMINNMIWFFIVSVFLLFVVLCKVNWFCVFLFKIIKRRYGKWDCVNYLYD